MKKLLMTSLIATMPLLASPCFALDEVNVSNGISAAGEPLAVHGADTVALLDTGKVVNGSATHALNYEGASYYFASAENEAKFKANPEKYAPQHGGFCSYGVAVGKKFDGHPTKHVVHDGKLFLFLNDKTRDLFLEDVAGLKTNADENWKKIKHTAVGDL